MQSLILRYVDWDNVEKITIWSATHIDNIIKTNTKQIVEIIGYKQKKEVWETMLEAKQEDLYLLLTTILEDNHLYNIHPN